MEKDTIVEGMMLVSTLVEDADDKLMEDARVLSRQIHSDVDFRGYQYDVILIALSTLLSAITAIVDEKAQQEGVINIEDFRN